MGSGTGCQLCFLICEMGAKHAAFPRNRGRELFPPLPCGSRLPHVTVGHITPSRL